MSRLRDARDVSCIHNDNLARNSQFGFRRALPVATGHPAVLTADDDKTFDEDVMGTSATRDGTQIDCKSWGLDSLRSSAAVDHCHRALG
jgi:hypothetical protein